MSTLTGYALENVAISTTTMLDQVLERFRTTRAKTEALMEGLSDADASAQSMPDASPAKWHLAHTTWFFETFVLRQDEAYVPFDPRFAYLFNSYYEAIGPRIQRATRGLQTRPTLDEIRRYRKHVDAAIIYGDKALLSAAAQLIELGCHHEEQHQELLLTDILHLFAQNPFYPAVQPISQKKSIATEPLQWVQGLAGPTQIGHDGNGFAFDCEGPRHTTWLAPYALANRLVTNAEWHMFVLDGGYTKPNLWLSDGWAWVQQNNIRSPLYWLEDASKEWSQHFGLSGVVPLDLDLPVCHISFYEADAFARWSGYRLPTEAEWESAASEQRQTSIEVSAVPGSAPTGYKLNGSSLNQLFDSCWQWTGSSFLPYPSFRVPPGAVGEYNGKFMSGQFVLRGGSCATPPEHSRTTYRNFFYPHQRWQFTGLRLAKDL